MNGINSYNKKYIITKVYEFLKQLRGNKSQKILKNRTY